jgi:phage shock protein A
LGGISGSKVVVRAFFIGRAAAQALSEQVSHWVGETLAALGRWDAQQREALRQQVQQILERAALEEQRATQAAPAVKGQPTPDLQTTIDELRAEMARLRTELKRYRQQN